MKNLKNYSSFINEGKKAASIKYTVTDKKAMKDIQKSIDKGGFSEFDDLLNGEMTFDEFVDFVDNMGSSEVENAAEAKTANQLSDAVLALGEHLLKTKQINDKQKKALDDAWQGIPYDDSI